MVEWDYIRDQILLGLEEFMNWFLTIPMYGQILVIIGIVASLILAVVIVYYVLKGVAYLIYYILKGVYLFLKGIGIGLYKLAEALYYAISGKPRPVKEEKEQEKQEVQRVQTPVQKVPEPMKPVQPVFHSINPNAAYCSECGGEFTSKMHEQLAERGVAFCVHCGKGYKSKLIEVENY
jgi:putative hemolysin